MMLGKELRTNRPPAKKALKGKPSTENGNPCLCRIREFRDNKKVNHVVLVIDFFSSLPLHQAYRASRILFSLYLHIYFYEVESETSGRVPWSGD